MDLHGCYLPLCYKGGPVVHSSRPFPKSHTAAHIAAEITTLMAEWGLGNKIRCTVTDSASNMTAAANSLNMRHSKCIARCLNLVAKNAMDVTPGLEEIRALSRKIVMYFWSSSNAKERLSEIQRNLGRSVKKLTLEVDTRWQPR